MINTSDIEKIAQLSRLEITPDRAKELADQLQRVLKHFEQISHVDTKGVEPLITPTEIETYWREDSVVQELTPEDMLANAPDKIGNLFRVPPVI